jgi:hypothetical protein
MYDESLWIIFGTKIGSMVRITKEQGPLVFSTAPSFSEEKAVWTVRNPTVWTFKIVQASLISESPPAPRKVCVLRLEVGTVM